MNRSNVLPASDYGPICPQSPNGGTAPEGYGDEDCLVLNVWAPPNAQNLPVLVWIHGGKIESSACFPRPPHLILLQADMGKAMVKKI